MARKYSGGIWPTLYMHYVCHSLMGLVVSKVCLWFILCECCACTAQQMRMFVCLYLWVCDCIKILFDGRNAEVHTYAHLHTNACTLLSIPVYWYLLGMSCAILCNYLSTCVEYAELLSIFLSFWQEEKHVVVVNVSPISYGHVLLVPSPQRCLPQVRKR